MLVSHRINGPYSCAFGYSARDRRSGARAAASAAAAAAAASAAAVSAAAVAAEPPRAYCCACPRCYRKKILVLVAKFGCRSFDYVEDGDHLWVFPRGGCNDWSTVAIKCSACERVRFYNSEHSAEDDWYNPELFFYTTGWVCMRCPEGDALR